MDSVISLIVIILFIVILYGWSSNFYDKHKYHKKLYMLYKKYDGAPLIRDSRSGSRSDSRSDSRSGSRSDSRSDDKPPTELKCDNNPCKHGECVPEKTIVDGEEMQYRCNCNVGYSGYNCDFKDDKSKGVSVKLLEHMDELVTPVIFEKEPMFKLEKNQWNNYL